MTHFSQQLWPISGSAKSNIQGRTTSASTSVDITFSTTSWWQ